MDVQADIGLTVEIESWAAEPEHGIPRAGWAIERVYVGDMDVTHALSDSDFARIRRAVARELEDV